MTLLKKYKIIITVLAALLSVSMVLLTVQTVKRLRTASDEVTVRNNSIGAVEENWEFGGAGLLPGDSESKTYTVRLSHKEDLMLAFSVQVMTQRDLRTHLPSRLRMRKTGRSSVRKN